MAHTEPTEEFLAKLETDIGGAATEGVIARAQGLGVFLASSIDGVPPALVRLSERIHVVPVRIVLLTILVDHVPEVTDAERTTSEDYGKGVFRVVGKYGFMEKPDVPALLRMAVASGKVDVNPDEATYYLGRETFLAGPGGDMGRITESAFAFLSRNSRPATSYFSIPAERVVELGSQIDL